MGTGRYDSSGKRRCLMIYAGLVFAGLAALLHVYIFVMESLTWTSARTRAAFGTTEEEAETTKLLAFNQGFYNLFLAIVTVVGLVIGGFGYYDAAFSLIFAGAGSMLAAAVVLFVSARDKARAAVMQGTFPLIAIVLMVVGLAM
jgi:putative membrane protein